MVAGGMWNIQEPIGLQITPAIEASLINGGRHALAWGAISYTDEFGKSWRSGFRFRSGQHDPGSGWDVYPCEEGNEATEDNATPS